MLGRDDRESAKDEVRPEEQAVESAESEERPVPRRFSGLGTGITERDWQ